MGDLDNDSLIDFVRVKNCYRKDDIKNRTCVPQPATAYKWDGTVLWTITDEVFIGMEKGGGVDRLLGVVGDVDEDGTNEYIAIVNDANGSNELLVINGVTGAKERRIPLAGSYYNTVNVGCISRDKPTDIIASRGWFSPEVKVFNGTNGELIWGKSLDGGPTYSPTRIADIDNGCLATRWYYCYS